MNTLPQRICGVFLALNVGLTNGALVYSFAFESIGGWLAGFSLGCIAGLAMLGVVVMGKGESDERSE